MLTPTFSISLRRLEPAVALIGLGLWAAAFAAQAVAQGGQGLARAALWGAAVVAAWAAALAAARRPTRRALRRIHQHLARIGFAVPDPDLGRAGGDRLAAAVESLAEVLSAALPWIRASAKSLSESSEEVRATATEQLGVLERHVTALAQTGAGVVQLRGAFQQAAGQAQEVIDHAQRSDQSIAAGKRAVEQSTRAMAELSRQVTQISDTIRGMVLRAREIERIVDVVADLADQSGVLALNAAIEAMRAGGTQGQQFGVIAREVRSLSERSGHEALRIREVLEAVRKSTAAAQDAIDEGDRRAQEGTALAQRAGQSIAALETTIHRSSSAAKVIAASTRQQAAAVEQIFQAMQEIDRSVNASAAGLKRLEETSARIGDAAQKLASASQTISEGAAG